MSIKETVEAIKSTAEQIATNPKANIPLVGAGGASGAQSFFNLDVLEQTLSISVMAFSIAGMVLIYRINYIKLKKMIREEEERKEKERQEPL